MNATSDKDNALSKERIELQNGFSAYNAKHGFSYELWVNPPVGHFYETYKKALDEINHKLAPPLTYDY